MATDYITHEDIENFFFARATLIASYSSQLDNTIIPMVEGFINGRLKSCGFVTPVTNAEALKVVKGVAVIGSAGYFFRQITSDLNNGDSKTNEAKLQIDDFELKLKNLPDNIKMASKTDDYSADGAGPGIDEDNFEDEDLDPMFSKDMEQ